MVAVVHVPVVQVAVQGAVQLLVLARAVVVVAEVAKELQQNHSINLKKDLL